MVPLFAILTDEPNELVAPYHNRMPAVLDDIDSWLDSDKPLDDMKLLGTEEFCCAPGQSCRQQTVREGPRKIESTDVPAQTQKRKK